MRYFLGADLGGTKTHIVIADETGRVLGFGAAGPGNHEVVGFDGMDAALTNALDAALRSAGLPKGAIAAAGFGIAGYDWPSQKIKMVDVIDRLGLDAPYELVNDTMLGLFAGADEGWGLVIVSGTGCNVWGWDKTRSRLGRVTGGGDLMGEAAGASELVTRAMQLVGFEWTLRGPKTALSQMFMDALAAPTLENLLERYMLQPDLIDSSFAPRIFEIANAGDAVALDLIRWAGQELGEMANGVIRQLQFETLSFDIVLVGGMFKSGPLLIEPMRETIQHLAPNTRLLPLTIPPVVGAVLMALKKGNIDNTPEIRERISETLKTLRAHL